MQKVLLFVEFILHGKSDRGICNGIRYDYGNMPSLFYREHTDKKLDTERESPRSDIKRTIDSRNITRRNPRHKKNCIFGEIHVGGFHVRLPFVHMGDQLDVRTDDIESGLLIRAPFPTLIQHKVGNRKLQSAFPSDFSGVRSRIHLQIDLRPFGKGRNEKGHVPQGSLFGIVQEELHRQKIASLMLRFVGFKNLLDSVGRTARCEKHRIA